VNGTQKRERAAAREQAETKCGQDAANYVRGFVAMRKSLILLALCLAFVIAPRDAEAGRTDAQLGTIRAALAYGAGWSGHCWTPGVNGAAYAAAPFSTKSRIIARSVLDGINSVARRREADVAVTVAAAKLQGAVASGEIDAALLGTLSNADVRARFLQLGYFAGLDAKALLGGN